MPVTIEDKIEMFSKLIFGNIEVKSSGKRQKLEENYKKELEALQHEIEKKKRELMEAAIAKAERERTKLTAQAKNQQQYMLVSQKQQAMQLVMDKLQDLAAAFTKAPDYKGYMKRSIESALKTLEGSKKIVFYTMEKDMQLCNDILQDKLTRLSEHPKYEIKKTSNNIIGGIVAEDTDNLLQLDLTIKALIEENRDTVGAALTRRFNEVSSL